MSGCIVVSDPLVDTLIEFDADAPGVARGFVLAQCTRCDADTAGNESNVEAWAYAHVETHRHGRHTAFLSEHQPLILDAYFYEGRHRRTHSDIARPEAEVFYACEAIPPGFFSFNRGRVG